MTTLVVPEVPRRLPSTKAPGSSLWPSFYRLGIATCEKANSAQNIRAMIVMIAHPNTFTVEKVSTQKCVGPLRTIRAVLVV